MDRELELKVKLLRAKSRAIADGVLRMPDDAKVGPNKLNPSFGEDYNRLHDATTTACSPLNGLMPPRAEFIMQPSGRQVMISSGVEIASHCQQICELLTELLSERSA